MVSGYNMMYIEQGCTGNPAGRITGLFQNPAGTGNPAEPGRKSGRPEIRPGRISGRICPPLPRSSGQIGPTHNFFSIQVFLVFVIIVFQKVVCTTVSYELLYPRNQYPSLGTTVSYELLYPRNCCILGIQELLYPRNYCILGTTLSYELLYPRNYCIL